MREDKRSFRLKSRSMTARFRPVEANELVDNERAAQRLYMGSAITMEQGKLARSLVPCTCSCLQHAPPTSATKHRLPNPQPIPSAAGPETTAFICRSLTASWLTAMLETALFVSRLPVSILLYQQNTLPWTQCNIGHPVLVSRARSRVYQGSLHITLSRGVILAVHLMTCSSSWPIANVSI